MALPEQQNLPIGYWVKKVDQSLTEHIDQAQTDNGISRLEWQTLNALYESGKPATAQDLPVVGNFDNLANLIVTLERFVERGWAETADGEPVRYLLTEAGKHQHHAALEAQQGVRQQAMAGVDEEEYRTVIRVLQQVAKNLDRSR